MSRPVTPNEAAMDSSAPNEVIIELSNGGTARVSFDDYAKHALGEYRWRVGPRGLVITTVGAARETVYLSRLLCNAETGDRVRLRVRGVRGEELDYRVSNLRRVRAK